MGETDAIAADDRVAIKAQSVSLMIGVPEKLQLQLSEAVSIMAACDFPDNWSNLIQANNSHFCDALYFARIWYPS